MKIHSTIKRLFTIVFLLFRIVFSYAQDDAVKDYEKKLNLGIMFYESNNFEYAQKQFALAQELAETKLDTLPWAIINSKYYNALSLEKLEQNELSVQLLEQTLAKVETLEERDIDFEFKIRGDIAFTYSKTGNYQKAIKLQKELNKDVLQNHGEISETYAANLNQLGLLYFSINDCENSITVNEKVVSVIKKLNKKIIDLAMTYNNLGLCYFNKGDYDSANYVYNEALDIVQELEIEDTLFYSRLLSNISVLGITQGDYDDTLIIQEHSLQILEELFLVNSIDYADGLLIYGQLKKELGQNDDAIYEINRALDLYNQLLPENHIKFAAVKFVLAELHVKNGDTKLAFNNYNECLRIYKEQEYESEVGVANVYNGLGIAYMSIYENEKSLEYFNKALELFKVNLSDKHKDYGITLMNIGTVNGAMQNYIEAFNYYSEAIDIIGNSIGTQNVIYGQLCMNLLETVNIIPYLDLSEYENLIDTAITVFDAQTNRNNALYNYSHYFKALLMMEKQQYKEAEELLLSIKVELEKDVKADDSLYRNIINNILACCIILGKDEKALAYFEVLNKIELRAINEVFTFRSEKDKKAYLQKVSGWFSVLTANALKPEFLNSDLISVSLNNQLIYKGLLLKSSKDILSQLETINSSDVQNKIELYRELKRKQHFLKVSKKFQEDQLGASQLNELESELVDIYSENFDVSINFKKNWNDIKTALNSKSVAIEFATYTSGNKIFYIAYIIEEDSEFPKVVKLFNELELKTIISKKSPNQLYATRGSKGRSVSSTKDLYNVIWKPLESYLNDVETIYFSPVGLLNQVPFAALSSEGELLNDKYSLVQLSSTSLLAESNVEPKQNNTLLIGGIDYEYNKTATVSDNESSEFNHLSDKRGTRSFGSSWDYLSGTLEEINAIGELFEKNNKAYSALIKQEATEASFKALNGKNPSVLHIATHGFFFEGVKSLTVIEYANIDFSTEPVYKVSEDPLMRSGLILAGANYAWKHGNNPFEKENGILTASEISNLDLSNTDMVVLSACETGLGDIDGSEGVYGLQRAFKMAGVDIIVMSLWEVPDAETSEFMQLFYSNWLAGMKVREAFRNTQRTMSNKYKDNPEKWAAFVLFE